MTGGEDCIQSATSVDLKREDRFECNMPPGRPARALPGSQGKGLISSLLPQEVAGHLEAPNS